MGARPPWRPGACSKSQDTRAEATSTVVTTVAGAAGTAAVRDWDGVRFDVGVVNRIDRTEDGTTLIVFDRMQPDGGQGLTSGQALTTEPIVYGSAEVRQLNDTTRLRPHVATTGIEVSAWPTSATGATCGLRSRRTGSR